MGGWEDGVELVSDGSQTASVYKPERTLEELRKRSRELEIQMHNNSMRNRAYKREHGVFSDELFNEGRAMADELRGVTVSLHRAEGRRLKPL